MANRAIAPYNRTSSLDPMRGLPLTPVMHKYLPKGCVMFRIARCCSALAACLGALCLGPAAQAADEVPPLKAGDRIVFLGDSITQGGAGPKGYVTLFRQGVEAAHKDLGIEVIGAGISGNRVPDLEARLERDVLAKKPTIVVIYIGINDVWHSTRGKGTSKEDFEAGLKRIIAKIQEQGARVALCTPTVIGEKTDGSNQLDGMLEEYSAISRQVAADTKSQLIDLRKIFLAFIQAHNPDNKEKGILTSDTVHLSADGNRFLADVMLGSLGVTGDKDPHPAAAAPASSKTSAPAGKVLRHVVLFKFKDSVKPEEVQEVVDAFRGLPKKIDAIIDFEYGTDVGVENLSAGFTHCFFVTFKDAAGRDAYLPHPDHKVFGDLVKPRLEKVLVVDYWVEK